MTNNETISFDSKHFLSVSSVKTVYKRHLFNLFLLTFLTVCLHWDGFKERELQYQNKCLHIPHTSSRWGPTHPRPRPAQKGLRLRRRRTLHWPVSQDFACHGTAFEEQFRRWRWDGEADWGLWSQCPRWVRVSLPPGPSPSCPACSSPPPSSCWRSRWSCQCETEHATTGPVFLCLEPTEIGKRFRIRRTKCLQFLSFWHKVSPQNLKTESQQYSGFDYIFNCYIWFLQYPVLPRLALTERRERPWRKPFHL